MNLPNNITANFLFFLYNFPYGWENEFLKDDPMKDHLLGKYAQAQEQGCNSSDGIIRFFFMLGNTRQESLINWVSENYESGH